ncbi:hypothetical protein D3C81_1286300 [compost metagenome]
MNNQLLALRILTHAIAVYIEIARFIKQSLRLLRTVRIRINFCIGYLGPAGAGNRCLNQLAKSIRVLINDPFPVQCVIHCFAQTFVGKFGVVHHILLRCFIPMAEFKAYVFVRQLRRLH